MYTGDLAAGVVWNENEDNKATSNDQQWVVMKFSIENLGIGVLKASDIISKSSFYDKKSTAGLVAKVAVLLGDRKEYRVSNCSIAAGESAEVWYGILIPKSAGYPYLRISINSGQYCWLNTKPASCVCGMAKDSGGIWHYYYDGNIDTYYTGLAKNDYGWWYVTNGKSDWSFTGIASNQYGDWYMIEGKLQGNYSGKVYFNPYIYTISEGKVISKEKGFAFTVNPYGKLN